MAARVSADLVAASKAAQPPFAFPRPNCVCVHANVVVDDCGDHSGVRRHLHKADPEINMLVVKIGGPAYRIGMGGGAASSLPSGYAVL
jgi:FAD/FMN-containing dehydrogenase